MTRAVLVHAGICDASMWDDGGLVCLFAARHPELVTALVLLDAPLPDHEWSDEVVAYAEEEEERLLEAGDLDAATELNIAFWAPTVADRLRPMLPGALQREDDEPEPIDLDAVRAPTLVAVGEDDKADFHLIADRLVRELPDAEYALIRGAGHLPSLERTEATAALVRRFLKGKTTI